MRIEEIYHDEFYAHPQTEEMQKLNLIHSKESKRSAFAEDFGMKRPGVMFVAFQDDEPIGICCINMDHKSRLQLGMFVKPEWRNQGVGSAIWVHVVDFHNTTNQLLRAEHWGKGTDFYSKRGIKISCLYYTPTLDAEMRKSQIEFFQQAKKTRMALYPN